MSVKVESNVESCAKPAEVGDLFTRVATGDTYQIRALPSGTVAMCGMDGQSLGASVVNIADLVRTLGNAILVPFKPGESVTITQE